MNIYETKNRGKNHGITICHRTHTHTSEGEGLIRLTLHPRTITNSLPLNTKNSYNLQK